MKFKFFEWIKKRPSDLSEYYLKQSNIALLVSVMFFVFVLAYKWWNSPFLIVRSPDFISISVMLIDMFNMTMASFFNGLIFGVYDFVLFTVKISISVLEAVAFIGVPLFMFLSIILGLIAGYIKKDKVVLSLYIILTLLLLVGYFYVNVLIYFVFIILGLLINLYLKRRSSKTMKHEKV